MYMYLFSYAVYVLVNKAMFKVFYSNLANDVVADIVHKVKSPLPGQEPFRPDVGILECQDYIILCMQDSWHELSDFRPEFRSIRARLKPMRQGM